MEYNESKTSATQEPAKRNAPRPFVLDVASSAERQRPKPCSPPFSPFALLVCLFRIALSSDALRNHGLSLVTSPCMVLKKSVAVL